MKLLLLQNQFARNIYELKPESFHYKVEIPVPENPDTGADESQVMENYYFNDALIEISSIDQDYDAIVISHWLFPESTGLQPPNDQLSSFFSAVQLASFIRLEDDDFIRNSPIVIISDYPESEILRDSFHRPELLFASYGTRLIPEAELNWDLPNADEDDPFGSTEEEFSVKAVFKLPSRDDIQKNYDKLIRKRLLITDNSTDSHSVANHFGAFRIASLLRQQKLIRWPRNLYFKYLMSKAVEPNSEKLKKIPGGFKKLKVLLIDDQANHGWIDVLNLIFPLGIESETSWSERVELEIRQGEYDLLLLDYRLGETGPEGKNGLDRLRQIKGSFKRNEAGEIEKDENGNPIEEYPGLNPVMPVIMFTASNKAWNMDSLYEAGADGYYIKEHPDTASDADFSVNNFNSFIKTIDHCRKKGKLLKPYWQALTDIGALFSAEQGPVKEKTLSDGSRSHFRGRISERITMFIGLLKKAYEQTAFDEKAFFYSDYELAFLTLWSVLNELQESLFDKFSDKEFEIEIGNGNFTKSHPNRQKVRYLNGHYRWEYFGKVFIDFEYKATFEKNQVVIDRNKYVLNPIEKSIFKVELARNEFSELTELSPTPKKVKFYQSLFIQIAFLLKQLNAPDSMLSNLNYRNEFRNFLYLTHGEDANSSVFSKTYIDQRKSLKIKGYPIDFHGEIKKLFEIVYFLCTAKEWKP